MDESEPGTLLLGIIFVPVGLGMIVAGTSWKTRFAGIGCVIFGATMIGTFFASH